MATIQAYDLCPTCKNFYQCDHECSLGIYLEYDKFVIECDDYEEGEPMTCYFDTLDQEKEIHSVAESDQPSIQE